MPLAVKFAPQLAFGWADPPNCHLFALSEQARYTERIRQIDANTLEDQATTTDPVALTRPWGRGRPNRKRAAGRTTETRSSMAG